MNLPSDQTELLEEFKNLLLTASQEVGKAALIPVIGQIQTDILQLSRELNEKTQTLSLNIKQEKEAFSSKIEQLQSEQRTHRVSIETSLACAVENWKERQNAIVLELKASTDELCKQTEQLHKNGYIAIERRLESFAEHFKEEQQLLEKNLITQIEHLKQQLEQVQHAQKEQRALLQSFLESKITTVSSSFGERMERWQGQQEERQRSTRLVWWILLICMCIQIILIGLSLFL